MVGVNRTTRSTRAVRSASSRRVRLGLRARVEPRQIVFEEGHHFAIAVLGRRHRLDDVPGVSRVVVAVVADEATVPVVRGEETVRIRHQVESTVVVARDVVGLEELLLAVQLKRAGGFLFAGDVRRGPRCDEHRACRQRDKVLSFPLYLVALSLSKGLPLPSKHHRRHRAVLI
jgi:hypothetical protein